MREKAQIGERSFALTADVKEAHRRVPIDPGDWHLLGCQVTPGSSVYINKLGTFGISSASYCWSRVASAPGRIAQYLAGFTANAGTYQLQTTSSSTPVSLSIAQRFPYFFVLCDTCCVPLSWSKTSGRDTVAWVGFELLHASSELRYLPTACRLVRQMDCRRRSTSMEGLGRMMFVAGALEYEKPFMGPLYRFLSLHPSGSVRRVPDYVSFISKYLARQITHSRHVPCAVRMTSIDEAPGVDAQASSGRTGKEAGCRPSTLRAAHHPPRRGGSATRSRCLSFRGSSKRTRKRPY